MQTKIESCKDAYLLLKPHFNSNAEEFWGLFLNSQLHLISLILIHRGTVDSCAIHPRDLFREAFKSNCSSIIIAHNHPSLSAEPSDEDFKLTKKLKRIGILMQIPIVDHIVFTPTDYYSFKDKKMI